MKHLPLKSIAASLVAVFALSACESPEGQGAIAGAALGSAIGAASSGRHFGRNVGRGALIGAGAGALLGHILGRADERGYYEGDRLPYARSMGGGMVESPYYPHNLIDTRGIPHGAVVEDPSTGGRFVKP